MKIGFIGLGIMGKPMAKNLLKAGYELIVTTHKQATIDEMVAAGAKGVATGKEVASQCEVIITMLPNSPNVKDAVLGPNGVLEGAKPGSVLIDMSSIDPVETRKIGAAIAEKGMEMIDAPVSGGEPKAIDGTLSVMCGGKKALFDEFEPLLKQMASSVVYVGPC